MLTNMVRNLESNLRGRLRNTDLPVSKCLFPLFEAVVNSIYAIDDRIASIDSFASTEGKIRVTLNRSSDSDLFGGKAELSTITIEDNGIGFDDNNYNSFCELDSMYRSNRGCKGIGRLLWLKCFACVEIESFYKSVDGNIKIGILHLLQMVLLICLKQAQKKSVLVQRLFSKIP